MDDDARIEAGLARLGGCLKGIVGAVVVVVLLVTVMLTAGHFYWENQGRAEKAALAEIRDSMFAAAGVELDDWERDGYSYSRNSQNSCHSEWWANIGFGHYPERADYYDPDATLLPWEGVEAIAEWAEGEGFDVRRFEQLWDLDGDGVVSIHRAMTFARGESRGQVLGNSLSYTARFGLRDECHHGPLDPFTPYSIDSGGFEEVVEFTPG